MVFVLVVRISRMALGSRWMCVCACVLVREGEMKTQHCRECGSALCARKEAEDGTQQSARRRNQLYFPNLSSSFWSEMSRGKSTFSTQILWTKSPWHHTLITTYWRKFKQNKHVMLHFMSRIQRVQEPKRTYSNNMKNCPNRLWGPPSHLANGY